MFEKFGQQIISIFAKGINGSHLSLHLRISVLVANWAAIASHFLDDVRQSLDVAVSATPSYMGSTQRDTSVPLPPAFDASVQCQYLFFCKCDVLSQVYNPNLCLSTGPIVTKHPDAIPAMH